MGWVSSVPRAAADLSLVLPDKGLCGCTPLAQTLFFSTWMLLLYLLLYY